MTRGGVVTIGETLALMATETNGALRHRPALTLSIGGAESNVAIGLRRLGVEVCWISRVGSDSLGDLVLREIRAEGVSVVATRDPVAPTALMIKERRPGGQTQVWYYRSGSATSQMTVDEVDFDLIRDASLLHLTGISPAISPSMAGVTFEAVRVARDAGVPVSFDLNFRGKLWSRERAGTIYRQILPLVDLAFASGDEATIAVGAGPRPLELAHRMIELGVGEAIVKLGPDGAVAVVGGREYSRPAVRVQVVDTVGAGDAFVAGYLAEYLGGADVATRLTTAVIAGACQCTAVGDWEGLPRRDDLEAMTTTEPVSR